MEMNAYQALRLLRRQRLVPRLQARQLSSLLRSATEDYLILPSSLTPLAKLLWLAQTPPATRTLQ